MNYYSQVSKFGIEFLNQSNYMILKTYLASYLIGKYLWDVVGGNAIIISNITNGDATKRWKTLNTKVEFVLKRFISCDHFKHIDLDYSRYIAQ